MKERHLDTLCVQAGYTPADGDPRVTPVVQSTTFAYDSAEKLANLFDLKESGYFYSRLGNPTCGVLEEKVAALEGGLAGLATASGQSANMLALLNVCHAGDHVISASAIYGGTFNLFDVTLRKLGIDTSFVRPDATAEEIEALVRPNTRVIFGETIANPAVVVLDFEKFAGVAKKHGILFVVDNSLATACLCRPLEHGADIVTYASTKYLDGHATSVGGLIIDGGKFAFLGNPRYPEFNAPDESYHGLVYARDCGAAAYITKARVQLMRDTGACMAPMNAFLTVLGAETLHLRMERTSENALKVAEFLKARPEVEFVKYPKLAGDEGEKLAQKYLPDGGSGMVVFGIRGGKAAAEKFIGKLKLLRLVTHIADVRSSVIHPASTTHRQLSDEALKEAGVPANLIRISVGIENAEDILADLAQAF